MKAKKTTKKTTTATKTTARPASASTGTAKTAFKVLRGGESWHGGSHRWSLPTQGNNGAWTPGDWTPDREPVLCETGYHLTEDPMCWWGVGEGIVAYLAEYDGPTDGPDTEAEDDPTKFAVTRARLLRPLSTAELEAKGIYLSGEHGTIDKGRLILGGTARFAVVDGSARVGRMYGSASVVRMDGSARVDCMDGSARVGRMDGSARVGRMYGSARVDCMDGSARAHASDNAVLVLKGGTPTVTLRGRASCLDYRPDRPVAHIAPEHGVLTINADGTTRTEGT
jgi:hypothetical protein